MIKLLIGQTGIGKTKEMIEHANSAITTAKGNILFIDESNESILEINHEIRYINISDYPVNSSTEFIAFLYGLMSSNYDIESIYLDGILNIYIMTPEEICVWLEKIKLLSEKHEVRFEISLSYNGEIPECFKPYL
ncbi:MULTISPECIES: twitching motility protein PilT [unclassified Fusibacter]|uniref:twitching motility protein PilT n=1 Tax=unclassified Fusibacter TaxID=2624464 RepID=UPI00101136D5|nr:MULTISPECIES: twitching motility protein PilT [unclassified Fusibacter]MCK8059192.1 twitching motility protein PilT [Fusibacter sp. A2]NPE22603.1 twitching motility protein PilT [Fusibacter sp. A1]RXV60703.1 twitching motility protein PilT [Fusibacter sp. A1]